MGLVMINAIVRYMIHGYIFGIWDQNIEAHTVKPNSGEAPAITARAQKTEVGSPGRLPQITDQP